MSRLSPHLTKLKETRSKPLPGDLSPHTAVLHYRASDDLAVSVGTRQRARPIWIAAFWDITLHNLLIAYLSHTLMF